MGETQEREICTTTDNEQMIRIERTIRINSVIPCPQTCYFYNGIGKIDGMKLQSLLGDEASKVVAWYKFKRNGQGFRLTLREKIIHKELCTLFSVPSDLFTLCLLITDRTDNHSTHSYSQTFLRLSNFCFEALPMQIINLSNSCSHVPQASKTYVNRVVKSLKLDINKDQGFTMARSIHSALEDYINTLPQRLSSSEQVLFELEQEVKQLRKLQNCEREGANIVPPESETQSIENGVNEVESPGNSPSSSQESSPEIKKRGRGRGTNAQSPPKKIGSKQSNRVEVKDDEPEATTRVTRLRTGVNYAQATQAGK